MTSHKFYISRRAADSLVAGGDLYHEFITIRITNEPINDDDVPASFEYEPMVNIGSEDSKPS